MEDVTIIGSLVADCEVVLVAGRALDPSALWLLRIYPGPCREYGSVRDVLSAAPTYGASMWTSDWSTGRTNALCELTVALYRHWIDRGCPHGPDPATVTDLATAITNPTRPLP